MRFYREDEKWYADYPAWDGPKSDLEMVCGADTMLDIAAQGENECHIKLSDVPFVIDDLEPIPRNAFKLIKINDTPDIGGAMYRMTEWYGIKYDFEVWLCYVTEHVFGNLPEIIYIA